MYILKRENHNDTGTTHRVSHSRGRDDYGDMHRGPVGRKRGHKNTPPELAGDDRLDQEDRTKPAVPPLGVECELGVVLRGGEREKREERKKARKERARARARRWEMGDRDPARERERERERATETETEKDRQERERERKWETQRAHTIEQDGDSKIRLLLRVANPAIDAMALYAESTPCRAAHAPVFHTKERRGETKHQLGSAVTTRSLA